MSTAQTVKQKKLVTFLLNDEYFAFDVHNVQEVFVPETITPIPQAPDYIAGVINFRGQIISTIDLKRRLLIEESRKPKRNYDDDERNYVLMVNVGKSLVGLLVDYVEAVITVDESDIQESLALISKETATPFIEGVVQTELGIVIILTLQVILSEYEVSELEKLAAVREQIFSKEIESGATDEITVTNEQIEKITSQDTFGSDFSLDDLADDEDIIVDDKGVQVIKKEKPKPKKEAAKPKGKKESVKGTKPSPVKPKAKSPEPAVEDQFGESPLDLNSLTKSELLRIAIEMGIENVSSRSNKNELVRKIQEHMNG